MKRVPMVLVIVLLIAAGGTGLWLVTRSESEADRVGQSFTALKSAVETRDPVLLASHLHMEYSGWGGDRLSALELFGQAIANYSDAKIEIRELKTRLNAEGTEATVEFEWTYRATLRSKIRTVTRDQMDRLPGNMLPWEKANAVFRKDENGRWQLQGIDTRIPRFGQ